MAINTMNFQTGLTGNTQGTSMAAGLIGEFLQANASTTTSNSSVTTIATLTLTTGVWLVSGTYQSDNNATQTGFVSYFYQKGTNSSVFGKDFLFTNYTAAQNDAVTFAPRVLVIAAADSDKTIQIKAQATTATHTGYGYLTAVRIA